MTDTNDLITAEEFFGGISKTERTPDKTSRRRRKRPTTDLFEETKLRMVMRINGVSRAKALEIIADRAKKPPRGDDSGDCAASSDDDDDDGTMSAEEFFRD